MPIVDGVSSGCKGRAAEEVVGSAASHEEEHIIEDFPLLLRGQQKSQ